MKKQKLTTKDKIVLTIIVVTALLVSIATNAQSNFRLQDKESFNLSISIDPKASINENGLDVVGEIEYAGKVYIKAGFESFSTLQGGYTDVHWGFGANFTSGYFNQWRYYSGIRTACVWRASGYGINYGLEGGIQYNITEQFFIGYRVTYDYRLEQKAIFGWDPELKLSNFITLGIKL